MDERGAAGWLIARAARQQADTWAASEDREGWRPYLAANIAAGELGERPPYWSVAAARDVWTRLAAGPVSGEFGDLRPGELAQLREWLTLGAWLYCRHLVPRGFKPPKDIEARRIGEKPERRTTDPDILWRA